DFDHDFSKKIRKINFFFFVAKNSQGRPISLGADEGCQSHQDFLMSGSRDDSPASNIHLDNLSSQFSVE
ncbi:MAG: hypothetical protein CL980_01835, partial [Euryarchaeota archaeon]|nr:hypothetical protein [Euryarchaeota archaeon]